LGSINAESIIFLHGYTDTSYSWSSTAPLLADQCHVFMLDQRGFGDSDRPEGGYTISQFAEDVIAFMDALKIRKAVLVGHSIGTFIAHQVA